MPEFIRDQPRRKAVSSIATLADFKRRHEWCQCCGLRTDALTLHHILGGRCGRSDEDTNLLALCWEPCHMLFEGHQIRVPADTMRNNGTLAGYWYMLEIYPGGRLPLLNIGHAISMKLRAGEMTDVDLARLQELKGSKLPDAIPVPAYFVDLWKRNRPEVPR